MSIISRIKGFGAGLACGIAAPIAATIGLPYIFTGETGGSGAGPAFACFFAAVATVIGIIALVAGTGLAALFSVGGFPWFVTLPAVYFAIWGLIGFFWFGKEDKKKVGSTATAVAN